MDEIQPDRPDPLPQWVPTITNFVVRVTCVIYEKNTRNRYYDATWWSGRSIGPISSCLKDRISNSDQNFDLFGSRNDPWLLEDGQANWRKNGGSKVAELDPIAHQVPTTTNFVVPVTCVIYEKYILCWCYGYTVLCIKYSNLFLYFLHLPFHHLSHFLRL